jgi:serine phosphatase RsbU (regulator of sigma subunit)/anti-sigma regulatory factor (Ser/Thr protein kinase)
MKINAKKKINLLAESKNLIKVRAFVVKYGRKMGLLPKQVSELKLAVDEAVSNIIRHAYGGAKGYFQIEMIKLQSAVKLKIIDQGVEFDWYSVLEPDLYKYVETRRKGGLGIWLIKKLIDEVEYQRVEDNNVLTMTMYVDEAVATQFAREVRGRFSIRFRYALYAVAMMTAIILVGCLVGSNVQERAVQEKFDQRYLSIAQQVAETSADLILRGDDLALANLAASVKQNDNPLQYVLIVNARDLVLADSRIENIYTTWGRPAQIRAMVPRAPARKFELTLRNGERLYDFGAPIAYRNTEANSIAKLGEVHIAIPEAAFREVTNIVQERLRIAMIGAFFWGTTIVGVFLLGSTFISPVRKLADEIARISATGQARELSFATRNPEVSRIGEAFNEIMRNLRITQGQLTDQTRLRRELQLAQEIQNALLPKQVPRLEGFDMDAAYRAAQEVGGDYYDFFEVDEHAIGIVVADVSGKGIGSSMVMTMIRTSMRLEARGNKRASFVLDKVNRIAVDDVKKGMYVTMFYVILDAKKRVVNYASAGHNPMIIYRSSSKSVSFLNPGGIAVGIDLGNPDEFKKRITSEKLKLRKGDLLFIYTDGITEAMNEKREQFGENRLVDFIKQYVHLTANEFKTKLNDELTNFTKGYPQSDDITFVVIKLEMSPAEIKKTKIVRLFELLDEEIPLDDALDQTGISYEEYQELRDKRDQFGEEGMQTVAEEEVEEEEVELGHATHEQIKILSQIIRQHPDYGVTRLANLLNSEEYGSQNIKESVIKRELVRMKLDTREKREAFSKRELPTWASYT